MKKSMVLGILGLIFLVGCGDKDNLNNITTSQTTESIITSEEDTTKKKQELVNSLAGEWVNEDNIRINFGVEDNRSYMKIVDPLQNISRDTTIFEAKYVSEDMGSQYQGYDIFMEVDAGMEDMTVIYLISIDENKNMVIEGYDKPFHRE